MFHDEDSFQNHLDQHPDDYFARGVFADWLEEQGDVRAEGYRAMLACELHGANGNEDGLKSEMITNWFNESSGLGSRFDQVPDDWFDAIGNTCRRSRLFTNDYPNRRAAEDALAVAFTKLPEDRRRELLSGIRTPTSATASS